MSTGSILQKSEVFENVSNRFNVIIIDCGKKRRGRRKFLFTLIVGKEIEFKSKSELEKSTFFFTKDTFL